MAPRFCIIILAFITFGTWLEGPAVPFVDVGCSRQARLAADKANGIGWSCQSHDTTDEALSKRLLKGCACIERGDLRLMSLYSGSYHNFSSLAYAAVGALDIFDSASG